MNDYLLSVVLGIIEGLTEFLPVSSTAHLRISEAIFHLSLSDGYWKMYSIVIQLGAILCLPVYFREPDRKISLHVSAGREWGSHRLHAPAQPGAHCVCGDRDSRFSADQGHRQEPGKHAHHRLVIGGRRNRDVDRRCGQGQGGSGGPGRRRAPSAPGRWRP